MKKAVVIGGGVAGLAVAHRLLSRAAGTVQVTLVEASDRLGGWVKSDFVEGHGLMECGPRSLRSVGSGLETLELIAELGIVDQIIPATQKSKVRYLYTGGKRQALPSSIATALSNPFTLPLATGILLEPFQNRRLESISDESLASFFSRRFGPFYANTLLSAIVSGVWAGDAKKLSAKSCLPYFFDLEARRGSLILGAIRDAMGGSGGGSARRRHAGFEEAKARAGKAGVFSFYHGIETLSSALVSDIKKRGGEVRLESPVTKLSKKSNGQEGQATVTLGDGTELEADHVFCCVNADVAAKIISEIDPESAALLATIRSTSLAVISLAYPPDADIVGGFGHLIPEKEGENVLGIVYDSDSFPAQRPPDHMPQPTQGVRRMTVMAGGETRGGVAFLEKHSDSDLIRLATSAVTSHLGLEGHVAATVQRVYNAIPQYNVGHAEARDRARERLGEHVPFLSLAGCAYDGVGVNDCILRGRREADAYLGNVYIQGSGGKA